jgi:3-deoxy-D-manno-octulosonic-acid transferase
MWNFYDIAYGIGLGISAPYWALRQQSRRKVTTALDQRMGHDIAPRAGDEPCILIHAVSVGEINATRSLIQKLRDAMPRLKFVISTTTDTGFTRGQELYPPAAGIPIIKYPLDFSGAIHRVLDAVRPDLIVLMELEVWPNFVRRCDERGIPVVLANARLTPSSFKHYRWGGPIIRRMFNRLALVCAQDQTYADRFLKLGVPQGRLIITGTMKFDTASFAPPLPAARHRAVMLGLNLGVDPVWVCGSTGPGEEAIILRAYRQLLRQFARLRLVIVPRHPPRFNEVAEIIEQHHFHCLRLSRVEGNTRPPDSVLPPVILIDAMGVLRDFYAIANIVFVGRSIVDLGPRQHGSDMIEPAALGKACIVGPHTGNFAEAMRKFVEAEAMLVAPDEEALAQSVAVLLSTPSEAMAMGVRAERVVRREQGSTLRHARAIFQIQQSKLGESSMQVPTPEQAAMREITPGVPNAPPAPIYTEITPPVRPSGKVVITSIGAVPVAPPQPSSSEQR